LYQTSIYCKVSEFLQLTGWMTLKKFKWPSIQKVRGSKWPPVVNCKGKPCLQLFLNYYIAARISTPFCRSIAHKHKDLHAQTSHQAQTSNHWRGISFHWKCLLILNLVVSCFTMDFCSAFENQNFICWFS